MRGAGEKETLDINGVGKENEEEGEEEDETKLTNGGSLTWRVCFYHLFGYRVVVDCAMLFMADRIQLIARTKRARGALYVLHEWMCDGRRIFFILIMLLAVSCMCGCCYCGT